MDYGEAPRQLTELERLKMRMNQTTDESLESTRRMVQLTDEAHKTGVATMEQLGTQRERLQQVDRNMDVIHHDIREAEENLEYLERCCGCCIPPWSKAKRLAPERSPRVQQTRPPAPAAYGGQAQPYSTGQQMNTQMVRPAIPGQGQFVTRITNDAREDEMETNLQHVAGVVTDLRMMATDMNQEIRSHNEILERISGKTADERSRIASAQARAERIVGEPAKKEQDLLPSTQNLGLKAAKFMM